MKLIFEDYDSDFELDSDIRSKVYNALADIAFDFNDRGISAIELKKYFAYALEWFQDRFWDMEDLEESKTLGPAIQAAIKAKRKDVDLTSIETTLAHALAQDNAKSKVDDILMRLNLQEISFQQAGKEFCDLFDTFDKVSPDVISDEKQTIMNICNSPSPWRKKLAWLSTSLGTMSGADKSLQVGRKIYT